MRDVARSMTTTVPAFAAASSSSSSELQCGALLHRPQPAGRLACLHSSHLRKDHAYSQEVLGGCRRFSRKGKSWQRRYSMFFERHSISGRREDKVLPDLVWCAATSGVSPANSFDEQRLSADDLGKWQAAREPLLQLGLAAEDVDRCLGKSFGWVSSPYWGEEKPKTMPECVHVQKTLGFLQGIGLSDADLSTLLKKFPEVLGCQVEEEMQKNVKILEQDWGIAGTTLKNLLLRNPKVLGYNVDCKGDCMAQCTRCWVRF